MSNGNSNGREVSGLSLILLFSEPTLSPFYPPTRINQTRIFINDDKKKCSFRLAINIGAQSSLSLDFPFLYQQTTRFVRAINIRILFYRRSTNRKQRFIALVIGGKITMRKIYTAKASVSLVTTQILLTLCSHLAD